MSRHFYVSDDMLLVRTDIDWPVDNISALEMSVEKWQAVVDFMSDGHSHISDGSSRTCALCHMYIGSNCEGCPVAKKSRNVGCEDTPYTKFVKARLNGRGHAVILAAAQRELDFLLDLLKELNGGRNEH